jgi:hypothetical protein
MASFSLFALPHAGARQKGPVGQRCRHPHTAQLHAAAPPVGPTISRGGGGRGARPSSFAATARQPSVVCSHPPGTLQRTAWLSSFLVAAQNTLQHKRIWSQPHAGLSLTEPPGGVHACLARSWPRLDSQRGPACRCAAVPDSRAGIWAGALQRLLPHGRLPGPLRHRFEPGKGKACLAEE